jgi:nitrile hydratase
VARAPPGAVVDGRHSRPRRDARVRTRRRRADEPVFHAAWEGRVFALAGLAIAGGLANLDAFRHAIERLSPVEYLTAGYYGRWLAALERLVVGARRAAAAGAGRTRAATRPGSRASRRRRGRRAERSICRGTRVCRDTCAAGAGSSRCVHPAWVFPRTRTRTSGASTAARLRVRFAATELWGDDADPAASVHVDLFESYLERAP